MEGPVVFNAPVNILKDEVKSLEIGIGKSS